MIIVSDETTQVTSGNAFDVIATIVSDTSTIVTASSEAGTYPRAAVLSAGGDSTPPMCAIWAIANATPSATASFQRTFTIDQDTAGMKTLLLIGADDYYSVSFNGIFIGSESSAQWGTLGKYLTYDISNLLVQGINILTADCYNNGGQWAGSASLSFTITVTRPVAYPHDAALTYPFDALWSGAKQIWESQYVVNPKTGDTVWFQKDFTVDTTITSATIVVNVDDTCTVWLNGSLVGVAAIPASPLWDISSLIVQGNNTLTIQAKNKTISGGTIYTNPACIVFQIMINTSFAIRSFPCVGRFRLTRVP